MCGTFHSGLMRLSVRVLVWMRLEFAYAKCNFVFVCIAQMCVAIVQLAVQWSEEERKEKNAATKKQPLFVHGDQEVVSFLKQRQCGDESA